jgi:hypothetical protein
MKFLYLLVALVIVNFTLNGQNQHIDIIKANHLMDRLSVGGGVNNGDLMFGMPLPPGKLVGDFYLDSEWKKGTMILYDKETLIKNYRIRYDIKNNEIEIKTKTGIKVIPGTKVKSFAIEEVEDSEPAFYFNANEFTAPHETGYEGFYKILSTGEMMLLSGTEVFIKKRNYKEELSIGNPDDQVIKKTHLYYTKNNKVLELPQARKKFVEIFGTQKDAIETLIKTKNLNLKNDYSLIYLFNEYNRRIESAN